MLIKTRGIILRSIKYSETSVIIDVYTEAKGLQSYIVSGVRSKKAKTKIGLLQLMSLIDIVAYFREGRDLNRIKELHAAYVYQQLPFDIHRGAVGLFITELIQKTIREREEHQALFDFLLDTYQYLDTTPHPVANFHLHFMLELSTFLGFMPGGIADEQTPYFDLKEGYFTEDIGDHPHFLNKALAQHLSGLLQCTIRDCHTVKIPKQERKQLLEELINYYKHHIENFPNINAHLILAEVL